MGDYKRKKKSLLCLTAAVVIALSCGVGLKGFAVYGTPEKISGVIQAGKNDSWSGKVLVTGDVYVPAGVTLTIAAGTVILFTDRKSDNECLDNRRPLERLDALMKREGIERAELIVAGTLKAQGTAAKPIVFRGDGMSKSDQLPYGQWGGIVILPNAPATVLKNLQIRYAEIGITIDNKSILTRSIIMGCRGSLLDMDIKKNRTVSDVRIGVNVRGNGGSIIYKNVICWNTWGIHVNTGEIKTAPIHIGYNSILANTNFASGFASILWNTNSAVGFAEPNGIHVYQSRVDIIANMIWGNTWGIEVSKSIVQAGFNEFVYNHYGFVWYFEDDETICKPSILCGNACSGQGNWDYVKQVEKNAPADLPNWWFTPNP